jgi:NAD(P)-dependent dehydrogenase (short-subunit alcohol dehydrogenase family)
LVTGAASGIGAASATRLAEEGATVIVADVDETQGKEVVSSIKAAGFLATFMRLDVSDESNWISVCENIKKQFQKLHILVNNAGIAPRSPITDMSLQAWHHVMSINVDGMFLGAKFAIPLMENSSGGSIINISSIEGIVATMNHTAYCTSKGGVRLFTKALALECAKAKHPIRVNSVHPGLVETAIFGKLDKQASDFAEKQKKMEEGWAAIKKKVPLARDGSPQEIANAILFLASNESSYMTGSELVIDGGLIAGLL